MKGLNKFTVAAAQRLHVCIQEQKQWVEEQELVVDEFIIVGKSMRNDGFNLRQCIQALATGKRTQDILVEKFESEIGIPYCEYCDSIKSPEKSVKTSTEVLVEALAKFLAENKNS